MNCSVIMNTLNEEKNIEYALRSVNFLKECDEIIVVDMESTDKTAEIAKKYGAKIIKTKYDKYFDNARKIAIDNAKNEWCFLLDADEIITKELAEEIDKIVKDDLCDIAYIAIKNYFFGVEANYGKYPYYYCRLFKKDFIEITGQMHSCLKLKTNECKSTYINKRKNLIHFPYNNVEEWLKKRYRYINVETENNHKFISPFSCFIKSFFRFYFKEKNYKGKYEGFMLAISQATSELIADIKIYYDKKNIDIFKIKNQYLEGIYEEKKDNNIL